MKLSRLLSVLLLTTAPLAAASTASAALPRFPQPFGDRIVFVADGNVWSVGKTGGEAVRLTSAAGQDMFPRASPDGRWIAYTEASRSGTDVWVIPAAGGAARRLTYHPTTEAGTGGRHGPDNMVVTWTPDSKNVVYLSKGDQWNSWIQYMYKVPVMGGAPLAMPIDSMVGLATFGPDGHSIAYNRIFRNFRTWKRYNGGLAQQVFTYDFDTKALNQITSWSGTNTSPMWYGKKIYYLSDQDAHRRANIWCYDQDTKQTREVTHFTDYDIDFPALGADAIAFQQGGKLYRLDLPSEQVSEVQISVPDDNPRTRAHVDDVKDELRDSDPAGQIDYALAPNGKRTLISARGDIFSVPTEYGATRDLTGTPGIDEDHPAWSPDGRTIAYTTDVGGGQQIAIRPAEGGAERVLTSPSRKATSTARPSRPMARRWPSATVRTSSGSSAPTGARPGRWLRTRTARSTTRASRPTPAGSPSAWRPTATGGATFISTRSPPARRRGSATAARWTTARSGRRTASTSTSSPTGTKTPCPRTLSSISRC